MTKEQFNTLLQSPSTINLNMVKGLEEITAQFPYFSNAHLLLAKQYQGHENIRYESYLRKAAAYAADRTLLYRLIKTDPSGVIHIVHENGQHEEHNAIEEERQEIKNEIASENISIADTPEEAEEENAEIITEADEISVTENKIEAPYEIKDYFPEAVTESVTEDDDPVNIFDQETIVPEEKAKTDSENIASFSKQTDEKVTGSETVSEVQIETEEKKEDPSAIIARRIEEISQGKDTGTINTELTESEIASETDWALALDQSASEAEVINIPQMESDPETAPATAIKSQTPTPPEFHTFLEWLKLKDVPVVLPVERPNEYFNTGEQLRLDLDGNPIKPQDHIIENFIKTEPRIVPAKSEFYSAGNMARQSVVEHADLITETLARIYANQGNFAKAIDAYRRLSLKMPEKSSYFAALIKELEEREP